MENTHMPKDKGCDQCQLWQSQDEEWQHSQSWNDCEQELSLLFDPNTPSGASFLAFTRRSLKQFHLNGSCTSGEILSEIYIRAAKLVRGQGVKILNPPAWFRKTAYNIIRERHRQQQRFVQLEENALPQTGVSLVQDGDLEGDITIMAMAFQLLSEEEQDILNRKVIDQLSWQQIRELFVQRGLDISEPALRKRKERALKSLKKIFEQLKSCPASDIEEGRETD
jgi:DNA-directed RNA polymerase specialized sigma24 family protein